MKFKLLYLLLVATCITAGPKKWFQRKKKDLVVDTNSVGSSNEDFPPVSAGSASSSSSDEWPDDIRYVAGKTVALAICDVLGDSSEVDVEEKAARRAHVRTLSSFLEANYTYSEVEKLQRDAVWTYWNTSRLSKRQVKVLPEE